jgi:FtsH-binding integral membrane protein
MSNNYHLLEDKEYDPESHHVEGENTTHKWNREFRNGFIRKVFGIVCAQILLTAIVCFFSLTSKSFFQFQRENYWLMIFSIIFVMIFPCTILCCDSLWRKVPQNYICLGIFTLCMAYMVGYICGASNPLIVFIAAAMTFFMVLGLTVYAATTKTDITTKGSLLFILGMSLLILSLFSIFFFSYFLILLLTTLWIILFGIYLVYDIQLIVGNKEMYLGIEDYILGAILLYTDIINLFAYLLQFLSILSPE